MEPPGKIVLPPMIVPMDTPQARKEPKPVIPMLRMLPRLVLPPLRSVFLQPDLRNPQPSFFHTHHEPPPPFIVFPRQKEPEESKQRKKYKTGTRFTHIRKVLSLLFLSPNTRTDDVPPTAQADQGLPQEPPRHTKPRPQGIWKKAVK